ncbi:MAG: glycosyltransferase [Chloroflexota bacterium]|nr:glycosyltransferase [Chloroflexota bacterium]
MKGIKRSSDVKILLHIRSLDIGGSERQVISLAKSMADLGAEMHIAVIKSGGQLEADVLGVPNIHLHCIGESGWGGRFKYLLRLRSLINSIGFNGVYGFLPIPNLALLIARTVKNRPSIAWGVRSSSLDLNQYDKRVELTMQLEKLLSKFPDTIITNSQAALTEYRLQGYPNLQHIPNAIDVQRFKPNPEARVLIRTQLGIPNSAPLIGLFARIHPMKDHATFLQAVKILIEKIPEAQFICAGGTSLGYSNLETSIKSTAKNLKLDKQIFWLGSRNDPEHLMAACDITTLTSDSGEGFPNSVAESTACGIPCIATDIGDSSDIVSNFVPVVPPKNPKALALAWESTLNRDKTKQRQIALEMRQSIIDRFSYDTIAKQTLDALIR